MNKILFKYSSHFFSLFIITGNNLTFFCCCFFNYSFPLEIGLDTSSKLSQKKKKKEKKNYLQISLSNCLEIKFQNLLPFCFQFLHWKEYSNYFQISLSNCLERKSKTYHLGIEDSSNGMQSLIFKLPMLFH